MRDAADCNNVKACFQVAVIYFAVEGMISRGLSDDSWIQMCVREMGGKELISLTAALEFVSITRSFTEVHSFVAETIATSSFSGSFWTHMCVRDSEMAG